MPYWTIANSWVSALGQVTEFNVVCSAAVVIVRNGILYCILHVLECHPLIHTTIASAPRAERRLGRGRLLPLQERRQPTGHGEPDTGRRRLKKGYSCSACSGAAAEVVKGHAEC